MKLLHGRLVRPLQTLILSSGLLCSTAAQGQLPDFSLGGFLRLHILGGGISADRNQSGDSELWIPDIAVGDQEDSKPLRVNGHARETRLWMRAVKDTPIGNLEVLLEGDLDGDRRNGHDPRLRHAYLILGSLQMGQTYTTFTNTSALADIDSGIAVGNVVTRHRLIRWRQQLNAATSLTLALEDSLNRLHHSGTDNIVSRGDRRPPDTVARIDRIGDWGNISVSMLLREVTTTGPTAAGASSDGNLGSAFSLAGRIETDTLDNLRFMFSYGDALARYSTLATYADATVREDGSVELATTHSGLLAWQHFWTPRWRSTFAASYSRTDPDREASRTLTRESRSAHVNLIWTPNPRFSIGFELLYGWRSLLNGEAGDLQRLQATARLNF